MMEREKQVQTMVKNGKIRKILGIDLVLKTSQFLSLSLTLRFKQIEEHDLDSLSTLDTSTINRQFRTSSSFTLSSVR